MKKLEKNVAPTPAEVAKVINWIIETCSSSDCCDNCPIYYNKWMNCCDICDEAWPAGRWYVKDVPKEWEQVPSKGTEEEKC